MPSSPSAPPPATKPRIWWSNAIFFIGFHLLSLYGVTRWARWEDLSWKTVGLWFASWQLASFGITIGYHRLWSHQAFEAALPVRIVLAVMGCLGFQGSIRWWVLRHRLHHRFTDDPVHDPYAASKGLLWSHCGWIFLKPKYERMKDIDRDDLDADPVVRFQHKHYVAGALFFGLAAPTLLGAIWGEPLGGFVWGGLVARLFIWHTTFCINSLAHWTGLQPYTDEVSARGNYFLALLTSGEGNHNFHHLFAVDYRNGPHPQDWDPTKWIIWTLHNYFPSLVPSLKVTPEADVLRAQASVLRAQADALDAQADGVLPSQNGGHHHHHHHHSPSHQSSQKKPSPLEREKERERDLPTWTWEEIRRRAGGGMDERDGKFELGQERRWLLVIEGWVVDVGGYLADHPGGPALLQKFAIPPSTNCASSSFHSRRPLSASSSSSSNASSTSLSSAMSSTPTSPRLSDFSPSLSGDDEKEEPLPQPFLSSKADGLTRRVIAGELEKRSAGNVDEDDEGWKKDATHAFNGGVNNHSRRARMELLKRRVARLQH